MRVLAAIVQVFVLPVLDRRHSGLVRDLVAAEFVGDQQALLFLAVPGV